MEKGTVVRLPVSVTKFYRNKLGKTSVPCEVSERFLRFGEFSNLTSGGDFMSVDIMTHDANGNEKKLCGLMIDRNDLIQAIGAVKVRPWEPKP